MSKVIYYVAMSIDGFIADDKGGVEWLETFPIEAEDLGYESFFKNIGAVIIGSTTYEQVLSFGKYPYQAVESVVMTKRELPQPNEATVTFSTQSLANVIADLKNRHEKDIWIIGGSQLAATGEDAGLIDQYDITLIPVLLRSGVPLLAVGAKTRLQPLKLIDQRTFKNGIIQVRLVPERGN